MGQKAAKIKRRRESSFYNELSQFHRLQSKAHLYVPSLSSPSKNYHSHRSPIWKPSFTFHFTAISVLKRYYRKLFGTKTQTLPYYKLVPNNKSSCLIRRKTGFHIIGIVYLRQRHKRTDLILFFVCF